MAKRAARLASSKPNLPKPTGRPPKEFDLRTVEGLASIGCTAEEIAAVMRCSRRLIFSRIETDPDFAEAIEAGRARGRATLRRYQWQNASRGNATMQIWLGKQNLGQRDYSSLGEVSATVSASDPEKTFKFTLKIGERIKKDDEDDSSE